MKALLAFLIGGICVALAQLSGADAPEIHGTAVESGSDTPIAGVAVVLSEFRPNEDNFLVPTVVATVFTDTNGVFVFKPGHAGRFTLSAKSEGYGDQERFFDLTDEACV